MGCKSTWGWGGSSSVVSLGSGPREGRGFADSAVLAELSFNEGRVEDSLTVTHRKFYIDVYALKRTITHRHTHTLSYCLLPCVSLKLARISSLICLFYFPSFLLLFPSSPFFLLFIHSFTRSPYVSFAYPHTPQPLLLPFDLYYPHFCVYTLAAG